jgi:hypothetical protein
MIAGEDTPAFKKRIKKPTPILLNNHNQRNKNLEEGLLSTTFRNNKGVPSFKIKHHNGNQEGLFVLCFLYLY